MRFSSLKNLTSSSAFLFLAVFEDCFASSFLSGISLKVKAKSLSI